MESVGSLGELSTLSTALLLLRSLPLQPQKALPMCSVKVLRPGRTEMGVLEGQLWMLVTLDPMRGPLPSHPPRGMGQDLHPQRGFFLVSSSLGGGLRRGGFNAIHT